MKNKKYFVKFEFNDSNKPTVKYLYDNNKQIKLFYDLKELQNNIDIFCNKFNEQKIKEIYEYSKCDKKEVKVESFYIKGDGQRVTNMFTINGGPIYSYQYTIMVKI